MADPLRLVAAAVEFGMARYGNVGARRVAAWWGLKILGLACACAGGGFAVAALLIYLIPLVGPAGATLAVAGTLIAIGAISAGLAQYLSRPSRTQDVARPPDLETVVAEAEGFVRQNKALVLAAAFIAGMITADETSKSRQR